MWKVHRVGMGKLSCASVCFTSCLRQRHGKQWFNLVRIQLLGVQSTATIQRRSSFDLGCRLVIWRSLEGPRFCQIAEFVRSHVIYRTHYRLQDPKREKPSTPMKTNLLQTHQAEPKPLNLLLTPPDLWFLAPQPPKKP